MFELLFQCPQARARHQNGPLAEERHRFLVHCGRQQLSLNTLRCIAGYTLIIAKALDLANRPGEVIPRAQIEAAANCWANRSPRPAARRNGRRARLQFINYAIHWLGFLGRLQRPLDNPRPYAELVARFSEHMLQERGLSPRTDSFRRRAIQHFLDQIAKAGIRLDALTVAQIDELLVRKVQDEHYARVTVRTYASTLRAFFRYAEANGWCRRGLAAAILAPKVFGHEALPVGPSWDDVKRLLAAAHTDRPMDIRDRAILMLLAFYGLRSSEVVALRLTDFDWEQERITIASAKRHKPRTYPLCAALGNAVLRYLREVRPRSDRGEVFLTLRAPFRPLSCGSLWSTVGSRLRSLGVPLPHYGPHALRHACATHLLARGLSLKEIGDHLGHQSPETTRLYAKVDLAGLRLVGDFDLEGLL
jgi:site-specific recombinase XerD